MTRTVLSAPFTTYFDPAGNNTTGDGSFGNPFATPGHAYSVLQTAYDINGQNVTIQQKNAGTVRCADTIAGSLYGQLGNPQQVVFRGSTSDDPLDAMNYLLSPAPSGRANTCFSVTLGARVSITGFGFDNSYAIANGAGQAEAGIFINVGDDAHVWYGTLAFGFNGGQAWINHQVLSYGLINGNIGVYPPQSSATAATLSTSSNQATLSGVSGPPILPGAGVHGAGIAAGTYVASFAAGVVTFNQPPIANGTSVPLTFSDMVISGIGIGEFSYLTNAGGGYVSLKGNPRLYGGFLFIDNTGVMNWASIPVFQAETFQPLVATGSPASKQIVLSATSGIGVGYTAFGKVAGANMFPARTTVVSIDNATHATLNQFPLISFSSAPMHIGYTNAQVDGPKLSAWQGGSINMAGTLDMLPGTAVTFGGPQLPGSVTTGAQVQ